nr:hypothetical protein 34 [bacterium]
MSKKETKRKWLKFFPGDWQSDSELGLCSLSARGLWIEILSLMHCSDPYGYLLINGKSPSVKQLAMLVKASMAETEECLNELEEAGVFSRTNNGVIFSRRLIREEERIQKLRRNGAKGGNPALLNQRDNQPLNHEVNYQDNQNGLDNHTLNPTLIPPLNQEDNHEVNQGVIQESLDNQGDNQDPNSLDNHVVKQKDDLKNKKNKNTLKNQSHSKSLDNQEVILSRTRDQRLEARDQRLEVREKKKNKKEKSPPKGGDTKKKSKKEILTTMISIWNEELPNSFGVAVSLTPKREAKLEKAFKESFGCNLDNWRGFCIKIHSSPFLMGENKNGWRADIDWVLNPDNTIKILEGKYNQQGGIHASYDRTRKFTGHDAFSQAAAELLAERSQD